MSEWLINREAIEADLGHQLTEQQWADITEELGGRVDNFIDDIVDDIVRDVLTKEEAN